jgi:hypothetical protein
MFRVFVCIVACALPLAISSTAGAQSYVSADGEADIAPRAPSAPISITQRYTPQPEPPARELSLLIDESQPAAQTELRSGAQITSSSPPRTARLAIDDLGIGRSVIVVSNVRGVNE